MSTKVLLIYPTPSIASPQKSPPLSILHVGEALKLAKQRGKSDEDYEVRYYDERYDLMPDMRWPDVVGVSSMTGYQLQGAIYWLKKAKAAGKRAILGGVHATMQPEQCLNEDFVDAVVLSEGENAMIDAIHGAHKAIYQSHLAPGDHVSPVTPETLHHFRRSAKTGDTILLSSRGCSWRCGFCYNQAFFGRRWSSVDLDCWRRDVITLRDECGVTKFEHGDDWLGPWPRAREIIAFLQAAGVEYRPSLRANQITLEVARELAELGVKHISIGMETGTDRMLALTQKDITRNDQTECAHALHLVGIHPLYYWILGFPTETQEEINQTLDQADVLNAIHQGHVTQNFYNYLPLPGTALWEQVDKTRLPQTMAEWSGYSLHQGHNETVNAIYHIGGLAHHSGKGDKTDRNFPGWRRVMIAPFELSADLRWKSRYFKHYGFEKRAIEGLLAWAQKGNS